MACSGQFAETFINFLVLIHNCSCNVEAFLCDHYTLLLHDRSFKQNILRDLPVLCSLAVYDPLQKCGRYWSKSDSETEMKSWFLLVIYVKMWVNIVCPSVICKCWVPSTTPWHLVCVEWTSHESHFELH